MQQFTLSGRACIAVAALVCLERSASQQPMSLPLLAQRLKVSLSSIEQVVGPLRREGLVHSMRGPGGGYQPARAARDISVAEIIGAVEREPRPGGAKIHGSWPSLSRAVARCLAGVSLQDLVDDEPDEPVHEPAPEADDAPRRGISRRPVLEPVRVPRHPNTVFALADALK